jgi:tetratricopeptide (TPR) repeat protein
MPPHKLRLASFWLAVLGIVLGITGIMLNTAHCDEGSPDPAKRAQAIWATGNQLFDEGKFSEAANLFMKAHEVYPFAGLLYNLCQVNRHLGEYDKAEFFCHAFARNTTNEGDRDRVGRLLDKIAHDKAQRSAPVTAASAIPGPVIVAAALAAESDKDEQALDHELLRPYKAPIAWWRKPGPWLVAGAGVVSLGIGIFLLHMNGQETDCMPGYACRSAWQTTGFGEAALGVGLVGITLGTGWLLANWRHEKIDEPLRRNRLEVMPFATGQTAGIAVGKRW